MPPRPPDLLDAIAREPALAEKLRAVMAGERGVFANVVENAHAALCGVIARVCEKAGRNLWLVCENVRTQEQLHNELSQWFPGADFFPELESAPVEGALPDPETVAERLGVVQRLVEADAKARKKGRIILLTRASLEDRVVDEAELRRLELTIKRATRCDRDSLLKKLGDAGYEHVPQVTARGQFAIRGGIVDVFSFHHALPVRLEWFDEEVESIRQFDLDAQTSVEHLPQCTLLLGEAETLDKKLCDYIRAEDVTVDVDASWMDALVHIACHDLLSDGADGLTTDGKDFTDVLVDEPAPVERKGRKRKAEAKSVSSEPSVVDSSALSEVPGAVDFSTAFFEHGLGQFEAGDFVVDEIKRERFFAQLSEWRTQEWATFVFCNNEGEVERLRELLPAVEADAVTFTIGTLSRGFIYPAGKVAALSDAELFGRYRNNRARRLAIKRAKEVGSRSQIDFSELVEGELVVHLEHGIARFLELKTVGAEDVLVLEFAGSAKLYVPLEQSYLVARYVGIGKKNPPLSKLGDAAWANAKNKAEKAVFDYAGRLLELHATRESQRGYAFPPDNDWMREFEASFLYKETPDQITAIADAKADMESERPMDRLICGDVGFGKTEVAIRAAFKAVCAGKQVAVLVPTTVLAEQHYRNFRERVSDYPMTVGMLSRFRTKAQQNETLRGVTDGSVDIVIGTHRLISKDVAFKNLGLVVVDEEQRFGVLHKERFKEMWPLVDLLTLSATPIPRTLYMSLMGAKDMSTIETPPANRIPVETLICPYDERIIRDAINRELKREGQVYFLHNLVGDIESVAGKIKRLCPQARVLVGHGQMQEHELEEVMHRFVNGEVDVLVATTIIESGVDIPNANTIIIDRADRFGLADLYQLRGRVGRAQHKAYAYLMLPRDMMSAGEARKRINAIKQYGSLGAGFKIAMRDLEIRGAGNILGTAQSGHIVNVGFDLYCALLRQAIAKLKGERGRHRIEVEVRLDFVVTREAEYAGKEKSAGFAPAFIPVSFIGETQSRIGAYRRLNQIASRDSLDALRKEWRDRYGRMPQAVENLLLLSEIKLSAAVRKISVIEAKEAKLMLTRNRDFILIGGKFPRLSASTPNERLDEVLKLVRSF